MTQQQYRFSAHILVDATVSTTTVPVPETSITDIVFSASLSPTIQFSVNGSSVLRIFVDQVDLLSSVPYLFTEDGTPVAVSCVLSGMNCSRLSSGITVTTRPLYGMYVWGGTSLIVTNGTSCKVVFVSGITVEVNLVLSTTSLSATISMPLSFRADRLSTSTSGLLGNFNGNTTDEFYFRGVPPRYLPVPLSPHDAFFYFCKQCRSLTHSHAWLVNFFASPILALIAEVDIPICTSNIPVQAWEPSRAFSSKYQRTFWRQYEEKIWTGFDF